MRPTSEPADATEQEFFVNDDIDQVEARWREFETMPVARLLGFKLLDIDREAGTSRARFQARDDFNNFRGFLQGGMIAAMLDTVMSVAGLAATGLTLAVPTLEMKTSFLAPGRSPSYIGVGKVVRLGRSIAFFEGRLLDEADNLIATSSSTARLVPIGNSYAK
jgi:uncharacterized protein (TIGR00369 family)